LQRGCTDLGPHPSAQYNGVVTLAAHRLSQSFKVGCPLGQNQAVPSSVECSHNVAEDLPGTVVVGDNAT
jgi:hypothetical protein